MRVLALDVLGRAHGDNQPRLPAKGAVVRSGRFPLPPFPPGPSSSPLFRFLAGCYDSHDVWPWGSINSPPVIYSNLLLGHRHQGPLVLSNVARDVGAGQHLSLDYRLGPAPPLTPSIPATRNPAAKGNTRGESSTTGASLSYVFAASPLCSPRGTPTPLHPPSQRGLVRKEQLQNSQEALQMMITTNDFDRQTDRQTEVLLQTPLTLHCRFSKTKAWLSSDDSVGALS